MSQIAREPARKLERSDIVLALLVLASVLTAVLILVFAEGETAVSLGVAWGLLTQIAVWVYVFVFAI